MWFSYFQVKIFKELGSSDDEYTSTLILGVAEFAGAVLCVILVHWTGKRKLLITTTAGCAVCLFIVAAYAYLRSISSPWITDISWIPIVFLNLNAFLIHAGIRIVPWVLIGEVNISFCVVRKNVPSSFLDQHFGQQVFVLPKYSNFSLFSPPRVAWSKRKKKTGKQNQI